jgi:hypothetical protein
MHWSNNIFSPILDGRNCDYYIDVRLLVAKLQLDSQAME